MNQEYKSIEEIKKGFYEGEYAVKIQVPQKLGKDYVFDENISVKKNKEMIERYNRMVDEKIKERQDQCVALSRKLTNDVVAYIVGTYNMNEAQARIVEGHAYAEKHSYMGDYFSYIDDLASFVETVLNNG